jgi:hypothetical protein
VGVLAVQAEWIAARCRDALAGRVLTVPSWNLGPVKHDGSQFVRRDDDRPDTLVFFGTDQYSVQAARA